MHPGRSLRSGIALGVLAAGACERPVPPDRTAASPPPAAATAPTATAPRLGAPPDAAPVVIEAADAAVSVDAASDAGGPDAAAPMPPVPDVLVTVERPYKLFERPRSKGAVAAAGQDERLARWNVGGTGDPSFVSSRAGYHPGARVVVDTKVLNARLPKYVQPRKRKSILSQWAITRTARKYGYWPYRLCFEEGLRSDQRLKGQTLVRFSIGRTGTITAARLVKTKLGDRSVAECLRDATKTTKKLVFKPAPKKRLDVELSIKLWPGDAPVPPKDPPDPERWTNPGEVDTAAVGAAVDSIRPSVRRCYAEGLERNEGLWGRLAIRVHLDERGRTPSCAKCAKDDANCRLQCGRSREFGSRFPDREVARCVLRSLRDASFPPPREGPASFVVAFRLGRNPFETVSK